MSTASHYRRHVLSTLVCDGGADGGTTDCGWMDDEGQRSKLEPIGGGSNEQSNGGASSVDRLREYYDGARNRLKSYLGREDAMGSGNSSPRMFEDGGGGGGGVMFQQRPPHCRLEGKQVLTGEEFTDISYSDLGFIINPQSNKKLSINNNSYDAKSQVVAIDASSLMHTKDYPPANAFVREDSEEVDLDIDVVSTELGGGGGVAGRGGGGASSIGSSTSISSSMVLQHRSSVSSFTLPGSTADDMNQTNVGDLHLEEVTT